MSSFEFTDPFGARLQVQPSERGDGTPIIVLSSHDCDDEFALIHVELDRVEEVIAGIRDMARQTAYAAAYHQPNRFPGDSAAMRAAALSGVRPERRALTAAQRQFLTFALDQAFDRMASEDGFTDEDRAALDHFRQLTVEEPQPEPRTYTVHINAAPRAEEIIRNIVRRGPGEAGMTR